MKGTTAQHEKVITWHLFVRLEINTFIFLIYEGNEDEIQDMDNETLNKAERQSARRQRSDDDVNESGGKGKYIHKSCNNKLTRTITCTKFHTTREGYNMATFLHLETNTVLVVFYEGNEDEIKDMDDETLKKDEIQASGQTSDDNASKSGGKEKYIHKCCNNKLTRTIICRHFQEPAGLFLGTPKLSFLYIQADDESNGNSKSIAESSSEEEMEIGETAQIGN